MDYTSERFLELASKAAAKGIYTYTPFLSMAEQAELMKLKRQPDMDTLALWGGVENAERRIARFGAPEYGEDKAFPIATVLIEPRNGRFSDELTHRDFLGALMSLGLEREVFGDIIVRGAAAYVFALERIAPFIIENLVSVKRTFIKCSVTDAEIEGALYTLREDTVQVSSIRLDALIARAYKLSREDAAALIAESRVFINSAQCTSQANKLSEGDTVSVRGEGRFIYKGVSGTSRKGKLNILIERFF